MVMQSIAAAIFPQSLPETFIKCNIVNTEPTPMAKSLSHQPVLLPIIAVVLRKARQAAALLVGLALVTVPPQVVFGQSNRQQEQQQREQQQRDQQQREQQEREQQQRELERMQQQQHASSDSPAPSSNASSEASR